jgi:hypothetical protein
MSQNDSKLTFKGKRIIDMKKFLTVVFCISFFSYPLAFAQSPSFVTDREPPILLTPIDIYVTSSVPAPVSFSVEALDNVDGKVPVNCDKISGQIFKVGKTVVRCEAYDHARNRSQSSFVVTVGYEVVQIPSWVKSITKTWSNGFIDDKTYSETIGYLIKEKIIKVPLGKNSDNFKADIPKWIKINARYWIDGKISDDEYSIMLQWMINNGLIKT